MYEYMTPFWACAASLIMIIVTGLAVCGTIWLLDYLGQRHARLMRTSLLPDGYVLVPIVPPDTLLNSMAMRQNHGLFAPPMSNFSGPRNEEERKRSIEAAKCTMRQLHEEVVGTGFYKYDSPEFHERS